MTYGLHGVGDDHPWVVLMKMVAQRLVGSLGVGTKESVYKICHRKTQGCHRNVNSICFIIQYVQIAYETAGYMKLNSIIKGVLR